MTITTTLRVATQIGNSAATVFPFNFPIYDSEDLEVRLYNRSDNSYAIIPPQNYTATGIGQDSVGGAVTYNPGGIPIPSTQMLVIYRTVAYTQDTDISNQDGFYPDVIERQLDEIVMQIQQVAEEISRSIVLPPTTELDSEEFVANSIYLGGMLLGGGTDFPATRRDGSPLQIGDLFTLAGQLNADDNGLYTFISPGWSKTNEEGTLETKGYAFATNGQTSVPISGGYTVNAIDVFRNGLRQLIGTPVGTGPTDFDCNASDGLTLIFPAATLLANDVIFWVKKKPLTINSLTASDIANVPAGGVAATNVQGAINELDTEKVSILRQITTGGLLTGGGDLSTDRSLNVPKSSNAQAVAGTDDTTAMTPVRVKDAITAAGANPATSLIASGTTAVQSSIDIPLTGGWPAYELIIEGYEQVTAAQAMLFRVATDGVPTFIGGAGTYQQIGTLKDTTGTSSDNSGASLNANSLALNLAAAGSGHGALLRMIIAVGTASKRAFWQSRLTYVVSSSGVLTTATLDGGLIANGALTHIRIIPNSGNIAAGALWQLYGLRN